jgi:hypothetical protein
MGKSCLRFKSIDEIPLDVVATAVGSHSVEDFIAMHDNSMSLRKSNKLKKIST